VSGDLAHIDQLIDEAGKKAQAAEKRLASQADGERSDEATVLGKRKRPPGEAPAAPAGEPAGDDENDKTVF
jgi:hypothetical protein